MPTIYLLGSYMIILLLLPFSARAELLHFVGNLDVVTASGKACSGMRGRHQIALVISNDGDQDASSGYFGGESVKVGQFSGSVGTGFAVRYPYSDSARAEGHLLKLVISETALAGELQDRHTEASANDCSFKFARLSMKKMDNDESARAAYQKMSSLFEAQLARSAALSFSRRGAYSEAAPYYEKALSFANRAFGRDSARVNPYLTGVANIYIRLGRYADFNLLYQERFAGITDQAVRAVFNNHRIRSLLQTGRAAMGREEYAAALEHFRQALEINYKNKDVIAAIMSALVRSGQHDEAISFLEQTEKSLDNERDRLDVRGAIALVHFQKAKTNEKSGRLAEAETELRKAIQLDPEAYQYLILLARWRHKAGNFAEAYNMLGKALERFKDEAARSELAAASDKLHQNELMILKMRRAGE